MCIGSWLASGGVVRGLDREWSAGRNGGIGGRRGGRWMVVSRGCFNVDWGGGILPLCVGDREHGGRELGVLCEEEE